MPTYEYACRNCGHQWEAVQRISEDPLKECPNCKQPQAERQISAGGGFILKGGGWYSDLYGSAKPKPVEGSETKPDTKPADAKAEPAAAAKSDTKTETKSETKTEVKTPSVTPPVKSD